MRVLVKRFIFLVLTGSLMLTSLASPASSVEMPRFQAGLSAHVQLSYLDLSPQMSYRLLPNLQGLATIHYLRYGAQSTRVGQYAFGYGVSLRYYPMKGIFGELDWDQFSVPIRKEQDLSNYRGFKADVFLGLGYIQAFGKNYSGSLSAHYNVNYKVYSAYENRLLLKAGIYRNF